MVDRPLWRCPRCGRTFANTNQTHTCAPLGDLDTHFEGKSPVVRATFDRIVKATEAVGPFEILAEKSRIAFHARMSFAAFIPRRRWLNGHLILARSAESPKFHRIEVYSPGNVLHAFRLAGPSEVDDDFVALLAEAYEVGMQRPIK